MHRFLELIHDDLYEVWALALSFKKINNVVMWALGSVPTELIPLNHLCEVRFQFEILYIEMGFNETRIEVWVSELHTHLAKRLVVWVGLLVLL